MKKLMMVLAAVALAGAAQAASWFAVQSSSEPLGTLYNGKGATSTALLSNWSVYMLVLPNGGSLDDWETFAGQVVSAFQAGTLSKSNIESYSSYVATLATDDNGRFDTAQTFEYANGEAFGWHGFLAVAFNGDAMYVSEYGMCAMGQFNADAVLDMGSMSVRFQDSYTTCEGSFDGVQGWYTGPSDDVPEPTSGLLMLVGLAGLALKRKRA